MDKWYDGCGIENEAEYVRLGRKALKSVYENGGFWIGQYEMGTDTARVDKTDALTTPVCKEGAYPYYFVTCSQAQERASLLSTETYTGSLLFGVQWDLALKFIETKANNPGTSTSNIKEAIKTNSIDWGNYKNATFSVNNGQYAVINSLTYQLEQFWSEIPENYKKPNSGTKNMAVFTTGATERNKILNIYDFAGNLFEWTLGNATSTDGPCLGRGGDFDCDGNQSPADACYYNNTSYSGFIAFRVALY